MSNTLPPLSSLTDLVRKHDLFSDVSLPPLHSLSSRYNGFPMHLSSPKSSSPPQTPSATRHGHSYAFIRSSSPINDDFGIHNGVGRYRLEGLSTSSQTHIAQSSNTKWTGAKFPLPPRYASYSSDEDYPMFHESETPDKNPDISLELTSGRAADRMSYQSPPIKYESEEEGDDDDGFSFEEQDIRAIFCRTSAERGHWKNDPISYQSQLTRQLRKSVPSSSPTPPIGLHYPPRPVSEPAPSTSDPISSDFCDENNTAQDNIESSVGHAVDHVCQAMPPLASDRESSIDVEELRTPLSPLPPSSPPFSPISGVYDLSRSVSPNPCLSSSPIVASSPLSTISSHHDEGIDELQLDPLSKTEITTLQVPDLETNVLGTSPPPSDASVVAQVVIDQGHCLTPVVLPVLASFNIQDSQCSESGSTSIIGNSFSEEGPSIPDCQLSPEPSCGTTNNVALDSCKDGIAAQSRLDLDVAESHDESHVMAPEIMPRPSDLTSAIADNCPVSSFDHEKGKANDVTDALAIVDTNGAESCNSTSASSKKRLFVPRDKSPCTSLRAKSENCSDKKSVEEGPVKKKRRKIASPDTSTASESSGSLRRENSLRKESKKDRESHTCEEKKSSDTSSIKPKKRKHMDEVQPDESKSLRKKSRQPCEALLHAALSKYASTSSVEQQDPETATLDAEICGMIIESLALSRASSLAVSTLYKNVMQSRPSLKTQKSEKEWMQVFGRVLKTGEQSSGVFGKVESSGKDDADRPLEAHWFYVPELDQDQDRAVLIRSMMPRPGKRSETKKYKQYYWRPLDKISRWDPEDDL